MLRRLCLVLTVVFVSLVAECASDTRDAIEGWRLLDRFAATKDKRYLEAARKIGDAYLRQQDRCREWSLVSIDFLRRLKDDAYDCRYGEAAAKAEPVINDETVASASVDHAMALVIHALEIRPGEREPIVLARKVLARVEKLPVAERRSLGLRFEKLSLALYHAEGKQADLDRAKQQAEVLGSEEARHLIAKLPNIRVKSGHPKLFADAATFERLRNDPSPLTVAMKAKVLAIADSVMDKPLLERVLTGRRLLTVSREAVLRLLSLSMAYRLTGEVRYLERARAELKAICSFTDWNPSHFLDTGEAMFCVGVAYDWLYHDLSESERTMIRQALVEKGIRALYVNSRWQNWWNNWNLVCHTGYLSASLAVADEEPELSRQYILAAVELMPIAFRSYAEGNFPEGPGYWSYATEYASCALAMLESACGTTYGLDRIDGFPEQTRYLDLMTGPTGRQFNFSDTGGIPGGNRRGFSVASFYLARHFGCPESLVRWEMSGFRKMLAVKETSVEYGRLIPLMIFWLPESEPKADVSRPLSGFLGGENEVAVMRSSWQDPNAAYLAIKGGGPGHSHGHQDGGSFVYECDGVRWFWDIGAEDYHKLESVGINIWDSRNGGERWKVGRYSLAMHNALMIDGCDQRCGGDGVFVNPVRTGFKEVTIDLSALYTNATKVIRKAELSDGKLVIRDTVETHPGAVVHWTGIVHGSPSADGVNLSLADDGKQLDFIGSAPWKVEDVSKPWRVPESENPGFYRATMSVTAPASGKVEFTLRQK